MPPDPDFADHSTDDNGAELRLSQPGSAQWNVHYVPSPTAIETANSMDPLNPRSRVPILLIEGNIATDTITTYPLNTNMTNRRFLKPKYSHLRTITFEDVLLSPFIHQSVPGTIEDVLQLMLNLPSGFIKTPYVGLGLLFPLIEVVFAIESLNGVTDLRVRSQMTTSSPAVEGSSYVMSTSNFDRVRMTINRIHDRALALAAGQKHAFTRNALLSTIDPDAYPEENPPYIKNMIANTVGQVVNRETKISPADQTTIVRSARAVLRPLIREKPVEVLDLSQEIEVVSLEQLIGLLKRSLTHKSPEAKWQEFFVANPFVLRLAFGLPIAMVGQQISVGGRRLSGSGDKISDFAVKAAASGNLALIEIKTPETALLESSPYRGDLHAPGRELSGAINQVLEQRYNLQQNINALKVTSRMYDVETYAVQCLVVAGRTPDTPGRLKSLELFRNGLKSVIVITFDELLGKLEQLLEFLQQPRDA